MPPKLTNPRQRRLAFEWVMLGLALFALGAYIAFLHYDQYQKVGEHEEQRLAAQARVINDNLGQQLRGADQALRAIASDIEYWRGSHGGEAASRRLQTLAAALGGGHTLLILDPEGRVVAASRRDVLGKDFSDRDYFTLARQQMNIDLLVVPPPTLNTVGDSGLYVSKAIAGGDGRLVGVVVASFDAEALDVLMASVRYAPDMWSSIAHGDGKVYLYSPARNELTGKNLAVPGSFFTRHQDSGKMATVMTGVVYATGEERMVAQNTIKPASVAMDKPLRVAVSRDLRSIYAGWRGEAIKESLLFALFAASAIAGLAFNQRRARRSEEQAAAAFAERRLATERLRLATSAAGLGVWEYDPESRELAWDAGMRMIYGVDEAAPVTVYEDWRRRVLPSDLPAVEAALQGAIRDRHQFRTTFRIRRDDGAIRTVRSLAGTVYDDAARPIRMVGINEDVTERWRAEEAVRTSEMWLKTIFEVIPVGITIADASGKIVDSNRASEDLLGLTRDEQGARRIASSDWKIYHVDGSEMPPEEFASVRALAEKRLIADVEMIVETPKGRRWLSVSAAPMGHPVEGVVVAYVDVGAIRRGEADLRKLSRAVEQAGTAVVVTDLNGAIEYVNPAACTSFGYTQEELIGQNPRIFQSGTTPADTYREMWSTILAGEVWQGELRNRRRDGSIVHEAVTISPVRNEQGRISHFVAIKEDITAQKRAESLQRDLERRMVKLGRMEVMGAMAGGVAHDFNNILASILGFSGLGKVQLQKAGGPARVIRYFEEIDIAGQRARALIQQLRAFSRGGSMNVEEIVIADSAREVVSLLGASFPESTRLETAIDPDLPVLPIDRTHLHQLLVNLCINARDAIQGDGRVLISAGLCSVSRGTVCDSCHDDFSGDFFRIAVSDNGVGITEAVRSRIFEPFFTTRDVGEGTGMGLAVVHGIVHLYHGHVQVLSEPGHGTEMSIYLPRQPAFPEEALRLNAERALASS